MRQICLAKQVCIKETFVVQCLTQALLVVYTEEDMGMFALHPGAYLEKNREF